MTAHRFRARLTEGSVRSNLVRMTVPMIWGIFSILAFNLADTFFVAQLGTVYLAAISFTFPVVMVIGSFALGLGMGAQSVISRAIGEKNERKVKRLTTDSLTLSLLLVSVLIVIGLNTIDPLFRLLGATEDLLPMIRDYMRIWYVGMFFVVIPMVGNQAIRAAGDTRVPSLIMTVAAVTNVVLDPLLIFGYAGFPRLELEGAAIATVGARALTMIASLLVLHFRERMLDYSIPPLREGINSWKEILRIGLPAAATNALAPLSISVITVMVAKYGTASVAAFGVASRLESFVMIVVMAVASSIGPFVGQNWGSREYSRVHMAVHGSFRFSVVWGFLAAVGLAVLGGPLVRLFDATPAVVSTARLYLWLVPISYGLEGVRMISSSTFNALGRPFPPTIMTLMRLFVLYIPMAYVFSQWFQVGGIFGAASLSNGIGGLAAFFWTKRVCRMT